MFSVQEAMEGRGMWVRTGYDICYHKNHFSRVPKTHDPTRSKRSAANACYYTATFTIVFPHAYDICYIAYHYPYTYTRLKVSFAVLLKLLLCYFSFFSMFILFKNELLHISPLYLYHYAEQYEYVGC